MGQAEGIRRGGAYILGSCSYSQKCLLAQPCRPLLQLLPGLQLYPKPLVGTEPVRATAVLWGALLRLQFLLHTGRPGGVVLHLTPETMGVLVRLGWWQRTHLNSCIHPATELSGGDIHCALVTCLLCSHLNQAHKPSTCVRPSPRSSSPSSPAQQSSPRVSKRPSA